MPSIYKHILIDQPVGTELILFPFRNCGGAQVRACAKIVIQWEFYP